MPLKIVYAANNSYDSKIRLWRFLQNVEGKNYQIKIAAYKKSALSQNTDWTLDSLLNISNPSKISFDNDNLKIYYEQIKYFNPDLIISDCEPFTSYVAGLLKVQLWQASPILLSYGLAYADKYRFGIRKSYSHFFRHRTSISQHWQNILDNSDRKFIYSHIADTADVPQIEENYEWVRPYHLIGEPSKPCQHAIVGALLEPNKNIYHFLKQVEDSVVFSQFVDEKYSNPILKDLENEIEYACNLKNSDIFLCQGHTSLLADAFYNGKYSLVFPDFKDLECVSNAVLGEALNLSTTIYGNKLPSNFALDKVSVDYKPSVKFLHSYIEEL